MLQVILQFGFPLQLSVVPCGQTAWDSFSQEQDQGFNRVPTLSLPLSEASTPKEF